MSATPESRLRDDVAAQLRRSGSVFAEDEADLLVAQFEGDELVNAVQDRMRGEPLEHILGWVEFAGLRLDVEPGVFVPRRRTVVLFEQALAHLPRHGVCVELCCGIAPVATAIAAARSDASVHASDVDELAVRCARVNLEPLGGRVRCADIDGGVPADVRGRVDVLVANAPYVPTAQLDLMPREARSHEPLAALDGGPDGTSVLARVVRCAGDVLAPSGVVVVESSRPQAAAVSDLFDDAGFTAQIVLDEDLDATCVVGRRRLD